MADKRDASGISDKAVGVAEKVFDSLWHANGPQDIWHWIILILIVFSVLGVVVVFILKALSTLTEKIAKLIDSYKSSGFPFWLNKDNKKRVRRRKQFCAVLDSDLAYLAKAENWNDQYFTDLEADVETEGGYYASALDKLRRKKSFGLRKERSLIRAIKSSTERAMQLVGEPGSGKSVALRHLAKQLAEIGKNSNDKNATVPLYINLREMEFSNTAHISVDNIRDFVLENIRRGDADTSAFVKENWDDYCNRGLWLFLFDSFDEIPAVLHAETGSNIIRGYSQALRQFLDGMGECKGILASREFKGPEALPWKKLRILPLSGEKQDELISNSFLNEKNMNLVRRHLANSHNSIGSTPLFLTLLCRYVRDEERAPDSDHDILLQHIERLSKREPDYLKKKYNLTSEELMVGAERLARLFAENENLSLAPSLDQIRAQLNTMEVPGGSIEHLISALVDSKIGRADVPNALPGDRRFAFAHRRYQEALFVRHLTSHPDTLSAVELLTEGRWREYAVTLLQSCDINSIDKILEQAGKIINQYASIDVRVNCGDSPLPEGLSYFDWSSENKLIHLLSLIQEGLSHRLQEVPLHLTNSVYNLLQPRWETGDSWDRCQVIRLGGLLPHDTLVKYLVETFNHGTKSERLNAFRQTAFTSDLPEEERVIVLKMLSNQVLTAKNREELLTIEALAARLPSNMGADIVVSRVKRLRKNIELVKRFVPRFLMISHYSLVSSLTSSMLTSMGMTPKHLLVNIKENYQSAKMEFDLTLFFGLALSTWVLLLAKFFVEPTPVVSSLFAVSSLSITLMIVMFSPFLVRHQGRKIRITEIIFWPFSILKSKKLFKEIMIFVLFGVLFTVACTSLGAFVVFTTKAVFSYDITKGKNMSFIFSFFIGMISLIIVVYVVFIFGFIFGSRVVRLRNKKHIDMLAAAKQSARSDVEILYSSDNYEQLLYWLQFDAELLNEVHSIRTFSSFVLSTLRTENYEGEKTDNTRPACLVNRKKEVTFIEAELTLDFRVLRQDLEDRLSIHSIS